MRFEILAGCFEKIEAASSRLEMTDYLAGLFEKASAGEINKVVYFCQGKIAADYEDLDVGLGEKLVAEAIAKVSGYSRSEIDKKFLNKGDLGIVASEVISGKKQRSLFAEKLGVAKVHANLVKIAKAGGAGSQDLKLKLMAELFNSASPLEAKYIARLPLGNLRLGIGDPTIMDAFAISYLDEIKRDGKLLEKMKTELKEKKEEKRKVELDRKLKFYLREKIEDAYNVHSDLGSIGRLLKENGIKGLRKIKIAPGVPIRPSLAERLPSAEEIVKKIGKCAVEVKIDGFRLAVHKNNGEIKIFSRRMENMTHMFPEIVKAVREQISAKQAIFEGEAVAYNEQSNEYLPFQITMQRKRKYDIGKKAEEFPLKLFAFDVLFVDGKNLMDVAFKERRERLKELIGKGNVIGLTESIVTDDAKKIDAFFNDAVQRGLEGIIAKDLNARYIAGARKFSWIKLKRSYKGELGDSVDVVVVGYFKGKGMRTKFGLGGLLTAVYDEDADEFKTIAKIGTGMTEARMQELEKLLSKIKTKEKPARVDSKIDADVWVMPKYVVEVRADEITKSPLHSCGWTKGEGYALRFPRMISMRSDKKAEQATTAVEILKMYKKQKHLKIEEEQ